MNHLVKYRPLFLCLSALLLISCGRADTQQATGAEAAASQFEGMAKDKVLGSLSVMILGSGGPVAHAASRASAGYLIFVDGQPRILMDAGSGTFQRLAKSGVNIRDLDIILLSHLHIDHTAEVSSMIKTAYFHSRGSNIANGTPIRTSALPFRIFGPGLNPAAPALPATQEYIDGLYATGTGLERYLYGFSGAITNGVGSFGYVATDVDPNSSAYTPTEIVNENGLVITAVGVRHGPFPALAFRIDYDGQSIVYSGDTNSAGNNMVSLATGADILIYDTAIMDDAPAAFPGDAVFFALHTRPTRIGEVATSAMVNTLVLSHITPVTEPNINEVIRLVRAQGYRGSIEVAEDLEVLNIYKDQ